MQELACLSDAKKCVKSYNMWCTYYVSHANDKEINILAVLEVTADAILYVEEFKAC